MSDHSFTSTRLMAQSAGQKAADAYSVARDALNKIEALRAEHPASDDEPDFDAIFDGFDRRLQTLERTVIALGQAIDGIRSLPLQPPPQTNSVPVVRRPRGRPRKVPA